MSAAQDCIFCQIANKKIKSNIVYENDGFIAFDNVNKSAPIHVLVIPVQHVDKKNAISGKHDKFWDNLMHAVHEVIKIYALDKTGYRLVNNGAGYHGVDHEHVHVIGGKSWKPEDNF